MRCLAEHVVVHVGIWAVLAPGHHRREPEVDDLHNAALRVGAGEHDVVLGLVVP